MPILAYGIEVTQKTTKNTQNPQSLAPLITTVETPIYLTTLPMFNNLHSPNSKKFVVAIDGPSASGKETLANHLSRIFNFAKLDTGLLYRLVGSTVKNRGIRPQDGVDFEIVAIAEASRLFPPGRVSQIDRIAPSEELRSEKVAEYASWVARIPAVRSQLLRIQRSFVEQLHDSVNGVIVDGRDIGSTVCPEAQVKLFVTADLRQRAARRTESLQRRGHIVNPSHVLEAIATRDQMDMSRKASPMKQSPDALLIDNTNLTIETMVAIGSTIVADAFSEYKQTNA